MSGTESDLAYYRRVLTRCYRITLRDDLPAGDRRRQIREACWEALERPEGDGEVIEQLKATVSEYKNRSIDLVVAQKEVGLLEARLAASERARKDLEVQRGVASDLDADGVLAHRRIVDLGCVLVDAHADGVAIERAKRWLTAVVKRMARELDPDELAQRAVATAHELTEVDG